MWVNTFSGEKNYDYRNSGNLIKTTIIIIISKSGQGNTYNEYEAGKSASYLASHGLAS